MKMKWFHLQKSVTLGLWFLVKLSNQQAGVEQYRPVPTQWASPIMLPAWFLEVYEEDSVQVIEK